MVSITKICVIKGCRRKVHCKDMCQPHYRRYRRFGDSPALYDPLPERHGMRHAAEYRNWCAMISRCYNRNVKGYANYGARGIKVCDEWRNSFISFYRDMGPRPTPNHTIDRKNVNGDYSPSNCHWATPSEQSANRRLKSTNRSGYTGVLWHRASKSWGISVNFEGTRLEAHHFSDVIEAAYVRDQVAIQLQGHAARLNVLEHDS